MKHPLKIRHWALREWMCFFFGHNWKHAKSYKTQYYDMDTHEVPYEYRVRGRGRGNYMWDTHSWWKAKCIRCREKTLDFPTHPWYKGLYWGITHGFRDGWTAFDDPEYPLWKRLATIIPLVCFSMWKQIGLQFESLPDTIWIIPAECEYRIWTWMEKDA